MEASNIFKNKWFWIILGVVILLLIIGYNKGWFSSKEEVTPPESPEPPTPTNTVNRDVNVDNIVADSRFSADKETLINQILSKIDNQQSRVINKVRSELGKLDINRIRGINSAVSVATHKKITEPSLLKSNCSPNEKDWNALLDSAGISCCHVCGGVWSFF